MSVGGQAGNIHVDMSILSRGVGDQAGNIHVDMSILSKGVCVWVGR